MLALGFYILSAIKMFPVFQQAPSDGHRKHKRIHDRDQEKRRGVMGSPGTVCMGQILFYQGKAPHPADSISNIHRLLQS